MNESWGDNTNFLRFWWPLKLIGVGSHLFYLFIQADSSGTLNSSLLNITFISCSSRQFSEAMCIPLTFETLMIHLFSNYRLSTELSDSTLFLAQILTYTKDDLVTHTLVLWWHTSIRPAPPNDSWWYSSLGLCHRTDHWAFSHFQGVYFACICLSHF